MRKSLYGVSMLVYVVSLALTFEQFPVIFMGYFFMGSFTASDDYAVILTVIVTIISMLFHTLAVFKSKKCIYVTRAILFLGSLFNLLVFIISTDMIASLIISVALLVVTFIEKTEYIVSNTLTQEELASIEKENADAKVNAVVENIISFIILPIILVTAIGICAIPFNIKELNEFKEENRSCYTNTMATGEQNAQFKEMTYSRLNSDWQVNTNHLTARLDSNSYSNDYWIINNDVNFLYNLYYDNWDSVANDDILVNVNYSYPDIKTAEISKICIGDEYDYDVQNAETYFCPDFTDEEKEILRNLILNEKYVEQEKVTITREQYYDIDQQDIFWHFEGEDTLYMVQGSICKLEDGKYYMYEGWHSYDCYILPDEICERLDTVWQS